MKGIYTPFPAPLLNAIKNQIKGGWSVPSWLPARALERKWARPWPHVGTRPASLVHDPPCIVDPTKLKYFAVTVMTAASTVLYSV